LRLVEAKLDAIYHPLPDVMKGLQGISSVGDGDGELGNLATKIITLLEFSVQFC
jgi:hypothetical protein